MPLALLVALVVAFGIDPPGTGVPSSEVGLRILQTCGGITLVAILAFGLGLSVALRVSHSGFATAQLRRRYALATRVLTLVSLVVYGWIIHNVGWARMVRANWGLGGWPLLDDLVVLLPYLLIQLLVWWGLFFAERSLHIYHDGSSPGRLWHYLALRWRQAFGLILPVVLVYVVRRDIIRRFWPGWDEGLLTEPIEIAILGLLVLVASPVFVRLAWPTRPLPSGALRRRLERVARRVGFRFTDILVWDTGGMILNACVTGVVPGFRYVLLTDALVESMPSLEVAAVFGHEIGHVAYHHLLYFGFFFVGSLGVLSLLADGVTAGESLVTRLEWLGAWSNLVEGEMAQAALLLLLLGLYIWVVFGHLSRRFERQADVYGSKVVSCDLPDCPPHSDLDADLLSVPVRTGEPSICPVGIRVFADALANVARCNGLERTWRSWRHGSIASRIAFLEKLECDPAREPRFQRDIGRLRVALALLLAASVALAAARQFWSAG
jgi:STE24 endopeptidase